MERFIRKNYIELIQRKVLIGNIKQYIAEINGYKEGMSKISELEKDNLEMKRVLLNLFAKAYGYEIDELDGLKWLKVNTVSDKTEQELKELNEKENAIINYVLKIKKELE